MNGRPNIKRARVPTAPVYSPPLVISIHGIRTSGQWQKVFASVLSGSPSKTDSFYFGQYGLLRFLTPPFNRLLVDRFYDWYGTAVRSCAMVDLDRFDKRPSVVAHSLGSWIVGNAMLKFEDVRFDKIVFAGSILPRDFDWGLVIARGQVFSVRNECGQKDPWPKWASRVVARTGTGGSEGFEWCSSAVENVGCQWFGHSDALMQQYIERHWKPFLFRKPPPPLDLLHGRDIQDGGQFSKTLDYAGTIIDEEAFRNDLNFPDARLPRGLSLTWIKVNPDIHTFLIDRENGHPAGYINAMPVTDQAYDAIRGGKKIDNEITDKDILPYIGSRKTIKVYLMSIAISEKYRRWGDGIFQQAYFHLQAGFLEKLMHYGRNHGVRVTHFLATAWTEEGRRICESFGMRDVGNKDRFGRHSILELDIGSLHCNSDPQPMAAVRRLVSFYKQLSP
jgi:pimeloyl-ACP methyl ester carboxylesterase